MPERVDDAAAFSTIARSPENLGRARVHGRPCRRHVSGPDASQRTREPARGPRRLRRARHQGDPLPRAVGADRTGRPRRGGLALDGRAAGPAARARFAADRDIAASRQRPPAYRPDAPRLRAKARRLRPTRGRALPVARPLHAGQRAADHGAVQRALRPLVPARPRPPHVPALLVNQVRGVRLAMRAIREVNPAARLVQTEDLGRAFSTPRLAYQAAHENQRRWLSLDLLLGRVDRQHPLRDYSAAGARGGGAADARRRRRRPLPARHRRHQPLPLERALPRRAPGALPGRHPLRQRPRPLRRRGGDPRPLAGADGPREPAARGLGALPAAARGHRGAHGSRATSSSAGCARPGTRRSGCAGTASTSAR